MSSETIRIALQKCELPKETLATLKKNDDSRSGNGNEHLYNTALKVRGSMYGTSIIEGEKSNDHMTRYRKEREIVRQSQGSPSRKAKKQKNIIARGEDTWNLSQVLALLQMDLQPLKTGPELQHLKTCYVEEFLLLIRC